jgi:hypothetical protein
VTSHDLAFGLALAICAAITTALAIIARAELRARFTPDDEAQP